ncbi:MAG: tRNA pseudouridine(55) synthase TruB [Anaerolineae bacterium]|nr:tRNA pseudouridine(55) synthase TruB [Anaerolineae bacterium]
MHTPEPTTHHDIHARLDHYRQFLNADDYARLVESLAQPRLPALRVNTLKTDVKSACATWPERYGWTVQPVPFCAAGWQITAHDTPLGQTFEHDNGFYYVQDAASMLPAELFSNHPAPLILDLAAAPGGKTTHLASRFADRGLIIANDTSAKRITALRSNLQNWGAFGALITNFPGERFGRWFPETFDRVLLDAPCSGDTLRATSGRKTRIVSDREREQLCTRQNALLLSAFQALKPGGEIVYATCTMAPEEDEAVIDALLRRFPGSVEIVGVAHTPDAAGLTSDGTHDFDPATRHTIRLWPHLYQTSGFFAALIRKTAPVPVEPDAPPTRTWSESGLQPLVQRDVAQITAQMHTAFGFDLDAVIAAYDLTLWGRDKLVHAVPARAHDQFPTLPHVGVGFLLGQWADAAFTPSHELVTRFWDHFAAQCITLDNAHSTIWRQGRDLRAMLELDVPTGAVALFADAQGRFIGRGHMQRGRVRNLLPKRLVQR